MSKKLILLDIQSPNWGKENLVLCFKNSDNYNEVNSDQFVCDIPLKSALQILESATLSINIDREVEEYLREVKEGVAK